MPSIIVSNISARFGQREVLRDITFDLRSQLDGRSSTFGLMGPSGSGKTTLLRYILDPTERPTRGAVRTEPQSLVVSFVPQVPVLFEDRSILDNARYLRDAGTNKSRFDEDALRRLAERLGMAHLLRSKTPVERLSGGEKQRLMLLRALSVKPSLLLLDEPCSGLDPSLRQEFLSTLLDVASNESLMIVYVSHHWSEISLLCDTVVYLDGASRTEPTTRVFVSDPPALIAAPPTLDAAKFVCEPKLNVLPARRIGDGTFEVGQSNEGYAITFPVLSLMVVEALGIKFDLVSKGPIFSLIKIPGIDAPITIAERPGQASGYRGTDGSSAGAWVYDKNLALVGTGRLSAGTERDSSCLRVLFT